MSRTPSRPVLVALAGVLTAALVAAAPPQAGAAPPARVLEEPARGQEAISALGDRLPEIAAVHDMAPGEFRSYLLADLQRWVGATGRVFVRDEMLLRDRAAASDVSSLTDPATHPYDQTFALHSRPGADRVLHLDFDGETVSGTAWNDGGDLVAAPFDTDGDGTTFSNAEMDVIQSVWRRVAEDYAPFDVDVTTEDPGFDAIDRSGTADTRFGTRVLVSDNLMTTVCGGGCGGVAYVGVFDLASSHAYYQPAWVFTEGTTDDAKSIAEAASHEAGHNLGLSHDGVRGGPGYYDGHDGWAPIMGVGYYQPITQFSRGEYDQASQTEDDHAVIAANGAPPVADDHGDTATTATLLDTTTVTGVISSPGDVDAFTFAAGAGEVTLRVDVAAVSPDLDVRIELRTAGGAIIATDDPASAAVGTDTAVGMGAAITTMLSGGDYVLLVDGVGRGDASTGYTDYGSLGAYAVSLSGATGGGGGPTASASATPTSGPAPLDVAFSSAGSTDGDGTITSYAWDFGDGGTSTATAPSHTYTSAGSYTATLTVTDDGGAQDTATIEIVVDPAPTTTPAAPTDVVASDGADGSATVTWTDNATTETGYEVVREHLHRNGKWIGTTLVATTGPDATSATDHPGSGTFRYRVRAIGDGGASAYSPWSQVVVTGGSGGDGGGGNGKGGGNGGGKKPR